MATIPADLEPFYGPDNPFVCDLVRQAPGESVGFRGCLTEVDAEAFSHAIVGAVVALRWPTACVTLNEGDTVAAVELDAAGAIVRTLRTFRVNAPGRRVLDGTESEANLTETA